MGKIHSIFLTVSLAIAGLGTLAYLESVRERSAIAFGSPSAVSTVRAYYAAVNHYMATGDIEAVAELTGDGETAADRVGPECAALSSLPALRQTYPHMHIVIDDLLRDGSTVVAQVSVEAGQAARFGFVRLAPLEHWRVTEILTVADGRVVGCAGFGPGQALVASTYRLTGAISVPGALVLARISFMGNSQDYLSIPAPAIVSVEHGALTTPGNGVSVLTRADVLYGEPTQSGRTYRLNPGDVLAAPAGHIVLRNAEDQPATVLATTFAPILADAGEAEGRSLAHRLAERLADPSGGDIGAGVSIRPLARSSDIVEAGAIELWIATIVVTPGGSAAIENGTLDTLFFPLAGNPVVERNGSRSTIQNLSGDRVLILIAEAKELVLG